MANFPTPLNDIIGGTPAAERIDALAGDDRVFGFDGNDVLLGNLGNDSLFGGLGDDSLDGGAGNDLLDGNTGSDTTIYTNAAGGVRVNLGIDTQQNTFGAGFDTLVGIENLKGSRFADSLTGNSGANRLEGDAGGDVLRGNNGFDTLTGGQGSDQLFGDAGNDTLQGDGNADILVGGQGADRMVGGSGADIFRFLAATDSPATPFSAFLDRILDFSHADGDRIDLSALQGAPLTFIDQPFTGHAGELLVEDFLNPQGLRRVAVDLDGNRAADLEFDVVNAGLLNASDFIL